MDGATLTDNFWANDILWQLKVLAYNLSVMIQKKSKFKKQEHRTFIDWFIAVPDKITSIGHQIELKCMNTIFIRSAGKISTGSSKRYKINESLPAAGREENMRINTQVNRRNIPP